MTGKDLLITLGDISQKYYEEAEKDTIASPQKRKILRKPLLVAAVIALTLLLAGCAVVYMLSLKEIKLGDQRIEQDVYTYDPNSGEAVSYVGKETVTQQVLTLAGLSGSPASKAAREWYDFCESFDPDMAIKKATWGSEPEFPEEYKGYGLYTQEQKDKLDEIISKYNLKLRGKPMEFKTTKLLFRALGMENVLNPESEARMYINHAAYYENGNLDVDFSIVIPGENGTDFEKTGGYLYYRPKDCFIPDTAVLTEGDWEEWNYATASGDKVLIIRSEESASAWIFYDMPNCTASLRLNTICKMYEEKEDGVPVAKFDMLTKHQLEQIAEAIDFSLEPKLVEGWETLPDNSVPAGQEINGYKIEPVSAFTDGYGYKIVLRVTAPEGVALTDPEDNTVGIGAGSTVYGSCVEDGDGKLNTCHYILSNYTGKYDYPQDGSLPYPEGYVVPIYWEDLYSSCYDFNKMESMETLLTEGTWEFDISLNNADTREVELLSQPITAKACVGWYMDGTDAFEDLQITSIKLRPLGIDLTCENEGADFLGFTGQPSYIVMLDGTALECCGRGGFQNPIDLDQVAYVQLADKTILPMPGVDEKTVAMIAEAIDTEPEGDSIPVYENGVELISEPVTLKSLAGYATDATGSMDPLYEYFSLTSFVLHPNGAVAQDHRALETPDTEISVIMKDGSQILLTNSGCGRTADGVAFSTFKAASAIDLTKADHLIFPDGTELAVPPM